MAINTLKKIYILKFIKTFKSNKKKYIMYFYLCFNKFYLIIFYLKNIFYFACFLYSFPKSARAFIMGRIFSPSSVKEYSTLNGTSA